jgi:hypothetical protein
MLAKERETAMLEYYINLDERGEFFADVRNAEGDTVFEIHGFDISKTGSCATKTTLPDCSTIWSTSALPPATKPSPRPIEMVMFIRGSELCDRLQRHAKSMYVHRFTGDHFPAWARSPRPDGRPYPLQFADDRDWLANTFFPITKAGEIAKRPSHCESRPTWPNHA